MSILHTLGQLNKYLTKGNLALLDTIFEGLVAAPEASKVFWAWFAKQRDWDAVEHAMTSLIELRVILNDYRRKKGY